MMKSKETGNVYFADTWFKPPFRAHHLMVLDAKSKFVAEAWSKELADAMAKLLNKEAK